MVHFQLLSLPLIIPNLIDSEHASETHESFAFVLEHQGQGALHIHSVMWDNARMENSSREKIFGEQYSGLVNTDNCEEQHGQTLNQSVNQKSFGGGN